MKNIITMEAIGKDEDEAHLGVLARENLVRTIRVDLDMSRSEVQRDEVDI